MTRLAIAFLLIALDVAVSLQVFKSQAHEHPQKIAQLVVIWLFPLLGALLCFFMLRQITSAKVKGETEIVSNEYTEHYAQNYESHRHSGDDSHQP